MLRFDNKFVVIIGGNSGIGLAAANAFAREGAMVVVVGRSAATLMAAAKRIGSSAMAHACDVSQPEQVRLLFRWLEDRIPRIDVLSFNAGVGVSLPIEAVSEAVWDQVHDTNVRAAFFVVQSALSMMRPGSSIVLTGSVAALKGGATGSVYASSKAAVRALGRSFAAELVEKQIRVNVVSPGPVDTPIFDRTVGVHPHEVSQWVKEMANLIPMKRLGTPEEVADAILFLSSENSSYITGAELIVDGGLIG